LAFAKRTELDAHAENANDLLRNLELFLKYGAGAGIRIVFDLASDIPKCLIDPLEFNAAILNLVVDARDAMPAGGEIQISTEVHLVEAEASDLPAPGAYVRVRVTDSGQGMSVETARKIFDPYFTTKGEKGTGLGLPQIAAFMRQAGGHVSVRTEPGQGPTFDLLFPSQDGRPLIADDLWGQIDRWVNEGGAVGDGFLPRPQERTDGGRNTERHRNSPARSAQSAENHNAD
jgi:signal transduction histidine kinase